MRKLVLATLGAVVVAAIVAALVHAGGIADRDAGACGVALFALVYIAGTVAFVPQFVLAVPAGFSYGVAAGFTIAMATSFVASLVAFALGRSLLRERVERWFRRDGRMSRLDHAVRERGLVVVLLLRLSPMMPFAPVNYMMSITGVTARQYVLGTALGLVPNTLMMVYLGSIAPDPRLLVVQLAIGLAITGVLAHLARRALHA